MKQWLKAAALLTCFSALTAGSCEKRTVASIPIPPNRMDCAKVSKRPTLPPEMIIDWSQITSLLAAQEAHKAYVASIRTREGIVAGYILEVEGELFACSNDAAWLRDWQKGIQ